MKTNDIAMIGLAVMGRSLALNMADHGYRVAAYNRSYAVSEEMEKRYPHEGITIYKELKDCIASLKHPKIVMLMVQAGNAVDAVIEQLLPLLEPGDIVIDGGNSYFEDTIRRERDLKEKGLHFFGVGISGGEEGARFGPSIMPGGDQAAYASIQKIFEAISAKAEDGKDCCTYIGENGAGHYVKMVHNGIEYADMQLIAESYLLLKYLGGFSNQQMSEIFKAWNQTELNSFLIQISADIMKEKDDEKDGELLDAILDSAAQKGTGRWTSIEALKQGVDVSMISAACNARVMSNHIHRRQKANAIFDNFKKEQPQEEDLTEDIRKSLYAAKIIAYAQGFDLLSTASKYYHWQLPFGEIASIFRAGCIIQAKFLNEITQAFHRNQQLEHLLLDPFFASNVLQASNSLRKVVSLANKVAIPIPALSNAIAYLDMFHAVHTGANLIQAQRDYFGAHTYQRNDREGNFHHEWRKQDE